MLRVHVSACTFTAFGLHSHVYMFTTVALWALFGTFAAQPLHLYAAHVTLCTCPCAYAWVWSLNLLLLCSVKCIYMKRRLTFPFRLKPWRPDILLTVAADILPLFPQENYITPLLSPLISLSNILFLPPLLCSTPLLPFNISLLFSAVMIALKRKRSIKTLRQEQKHTRITFVRHFLEKEEMSKAKPGLRDAKFHRWCWTFDAERLPSKTEKRLETKRWAKKHKKTGLVDKSSLEMFSTLFPFFFGLALIHGSGGLRPVFIWWRVGHSPRWLVTFIRSDAGLLFRNSGFTFNHSLFPHKAC